MMTDIASIPIFPASRPLDLVDKPLFDALFAALQPQISELTFAGLYLFRQAHCYRICRVAEVVVVLGRGYDGSDYAMPPLTSEPAAVIAALLAAGLTLYGLEKSWIEQHLVPGTFQVIADRDNFDYLYRREELATLTGRRFHKKQNRVHYFARRHEHQVEPYGPQHLVGSLALLTEWSRLHSDSNSGSLAAEIVACTEALQQSEPLGLQGVVVLVGERVVAFALGEKLNRETAVCHFEKVDPFLDGVGQLVNREFARLLFTDCPVLNREQDLGEAGLREAKLSYHPVALVEKCRIVPVKGYPLH